MAEPTSTATGAVPSALSVEYIQAPPRTTEVPLHPLPNGVDWSALLLSYRESCRFNSSAWMTPLL